ncbi:MAG TPA: CBS domain-containing protein [Candidatus Dormibacteraeota bacterium]|nr:CBS domain-containing protein [Candidatus Dormibacteraeota bacterium]
MVDADKVWTVRDVMKDVVSVSPSRPFKRVLDLLWINEASAVSVVDERGGLLGIITAWKRKRLGPQGRASQEAGDRLATHGRRSDALTSGHRLDGACARFEQSDVRRRLVWTKIGRFKAQTRVCERA